MRQKPAAPKNIFYCSICKEAYKNYSEVRSFADLL